MELIKEYNGRKFIESEYYPRYYLYLLQYCYYKKIFYANGRGVSLYGRWRLPAENFNEMSFPVPPYQIQKEISEHIDSEIDKIDRKKELIDKRIVLFKELKQSLIHHVVTGKVDVRGVAV